MNSLKRFAAGLMLSLAFAGAGFAQQQSGAVGSGPPEDVSLEVTVGGDGTLSLSQGEIHLAWGGYYRFGLLCPTGMGTEAGISFTASELLENSHVRLLSVRAPDGDDEINFHVQGLTFRQIDCEGLALSARFSFHPMRKGSYPFTVFDTATPPRETKGTFIVE